MKKSSSLLRILFSSSFIWGLLIGIFIGWYLQSLFVLLLTNDQKQLIIPSSSLSSLLSSSWSLPSTSSSASSSSSSSSLSQQQRMIHDDCTCLCPITRTKGNSNNDTSDNGNSNDDDVIVTTKTSSQNNDDNNIQQRETQQQQQQKPAGVEENNNHNNNNYEDDICSTILNEFYDTTTNGIMNKNMKMKNNKNYNKNRKRIIPHTSSIWIYYINIILNATRYYKDVNNIYYNYMIEILNNYITPSRLLNSRKSLPYKQYQQIEYILKTLYRRWYYVTYNITLPNNNHDNDDNDGIPRKVNILILGGSVTYGVVCTLYNPIIYNNTNKYTFPDMQNQECSWPHRLNHFLNTLFLYGTKYDRTTNDFYNINYKYPHHTKQQQEHLKNNNMIDTDLFTIYIIAKGGTNTESGTILWDLSLLPNHIPQDHTLDIIINSYSTNDMHIISMQHAKLNNITLERSIFDITQTFIRTILLSSTKKIQNNKRKNINNILLQQYQQKQQKQYNDTDNNTDDCDDDERSSSSSSSSSSSYQQQKQKRQNNNNNNRLYPLLIFYDDYIGNEQKEILNIYEYNKALYILSNYYGVGYISYSDTIRELVYRNPIIDNWFSPFHWPERQIHTSQSMHISTIWIIAYNLLDYITSYCSSVSNNNYKLKTDNKYQYQYRGQPQKHKNNNQYNILPPLLDNNVTLDNISLLWDDIERQEEDAIKEEEIILLNEEKVLSLLSSSCHNDDNHDNISTPSLNDKKIKNKKYSSSSTSVTSIYKPCYYSWVTDIMFGMIKVQHIDHIMNQYMINNTGWNAMKDHNKLGYVPTGGIHSNFIMQLNSIKQMIHNIHIMFMKSYGPIWDNSIVEMTISIIHNNNNNYNTTANNNTNVTIIQQRFLGYHDKNTSEIYHEHVPIYATIGDNIQIQMELIQGQTFKITGMALCDH